MDDIVVSLVRGGVVIDTIRRPLRWIDGRPAVTYRRTLWPVHDGKIYLDCSPTTLTGDEIDSGSPIGNPPNAAAPEVSTIITSWDSDQQAVISAPSSARAIVDAGPGTGKTAVACARIAHLIEEGLLEPVNCLVVSFTQTAIHEFRNRISSFLSDKAAALSIRVMTVDAYAWSIRSGFDESAALTGSYESGITSTLPVLRESPEAADYIERIEHVVVDEAQDIMGVRAEFLCEFFNRISPECGVTVFSDDAQAIYGFAENGSVQGSIENSSGEPLTKRLRKRGDFTAAALKKIHRSASPILQEIFTTVRGIVLDPSSEPTAREREVRSTIEKLAGDPALQARKIDGSTLIDTSLVLFRRRAEALQASAILNHVPHRLRLGGLPSILAPWISACFFDVTAQRICRTDFDHLWNGRVVGILPDSGDSEAAWNRLSAVAGIQGDSIDMKRLRRALARRQLPTGLCTPDFGSDGPILGTIHSSKGREAESVLLFLPTRNESNAEIEEEARIMFVGATRARAKLRTGTGFHMKAANLPGSGRAYSYLGKSGETALMTEIGREGDLRATGLVGRKFFTESDAAWAQRQCLDLGNKRTVATASQVAQIDFSYVITTDGERKIAVLSEAFNDDLWALAKVLSTNRRYRLLPPRQIKHIRLNGVRSLVVSPEDPDCERLHEPWASSGFMLAPTVIAYTKIWFQKKA